LGVLQLLACENELTEEGDVWPDESVQQAAAWAAITGAEPMAVPDAVDLIAELEAIRGRTLSGPESMRDLINEGRDY
jgi:hypothetical protein